MDTFFYFNPDNNPYNTLALEEYMVNHAQPGTAVLYLYVHDKTVVIGRNQNAWAEVRTAALEEDGGWLSRRISGGGAVYHDAHNLNFSFIMSNGLYDVRRQLGVVTRAARRLGVDAVLSGRNDILANGRKFSGNAFCHKKDAAFHHGTILINTDIEMMNKYLCVSPDKIKSKGVASVKSRVVNLSEINPGIDVDKMADALKTQFALEYGNPRVYSLNSGDLNELHDIERRNSSREWRYGVSPKCGVEISGRFDWGGVSINLNVDGAHVLNAVVYSDAMAESFPEKLSGALLGVPFNSKAMAKAALSVPSRDDEAPILRDISALIIREGY